MASVEEYEHVHGVAEVELQIGIMKLKRTCVTDSPYKAGSDPGGQHGHCPQHLDRLPCGHGQEDEGPA